MTSCTNYSVLALASSNGAYQACHGLLITPMIQHKTWAIAAAIGLLVSCKNGSKREPDAVEARTETRAADVPPTYENRVAGILDAHCTTCHARGGIGPMPLTTYDEAKGAAAQIVSETRAKHMPPWLPDTAACAPLQHSRALPQSDIDALARWYESGTPQGAPGTRPAAEAARQKTFADVSGPPARVVEPELGYGPKRGGGRADDYHCFVLDPKLDAAAKVTALRVTPGVPAIVHHVILYEVRTAVADRIRALDDAEPGPGYTCFGGIGVTPAVKPGKPGTGQLVDFDAQMIVAWAPGAGATDVAGAATALPSGTAIQLAEGSKLVMQVHYSLENLQPAMSDRTKVELWFAGMEPAKQAVWVPLLKYDFRVPKDAGPGDPRATARADVTLPFPLTVLGVAPHMHLRGTSARIESLGAPDPAKCLLDVPRWDFHHQEAYWLAEGVRTDHASLTCTWDNRASAQPYANGKRRPSRELRWGEGTDDEMCLAFLYTTL
ncbi:MAG: uncharacterized protein JWP97_727 [Labilithrix sp.]|nr:uncharacterized protein [Labilithrix sp.]